VDIKAVMHLGRFKDIVITLFRYGFDDVVERLDLPGKFLIERIRKVDRQMSTWERIRYMLVDLGPTYIKFGQIMSLRPDLIPKPLILELRKLQDEVEPVGYEHQDQPGLDPLGQPSDQKGQKGVPVALNIIDFIDKENKITVILSQFRFDAQHQLFQRDAFFVAFAGIEEAGKVI
jgi:hypothetical protein